MSPGDVLADRFRIGETIEETELGPVVRATEVSTRRPLWLTRVVIGANQDVAARERLERNALALRVLGETPGLLVIREVVADADGARLLVSDALDAEPMRRWLAGRPPLAHVLDAFFALLVPLAHAHASGLVHRDIRPESIVVARDPATLWLIHFGLQRQVTARSLTSTGDSHGSVFYLAPELAVRSSNATPAADVWSYGVVLYELLTGERPFRGVSMFDVVQAAAATRHRAIEELAPAVPVELVRIVDACLEKSPADRPADAAALAKQLAAALQCPAGAPPRYSGSALAKTHALDGPVTAKLARGAQASSAPPDRANAEGAAAASRGRIVLAAATSALVTVASVVAVAAWTGLGTNDAPVAEPDAAVPPTADAGTLIAPPALADAQPSAHAADAGSPPGAGAQSCRGVWRGRSTTGLYGRARLVLAEGERDCGRLEFPERRFTLRGCEWETGRVTGRMSFVDDRGDAQRESFEVRCGAEPRFVTSSDYEESPGSFEISADEGG